MTSGASRPRAERKYSHCSGLAANADASPLPLSFKWIPPPVPLLSSPFPFSPFLVSFLLSSPLPCFPPFLAYKSNNTISNSSPRVTNAAPKALLTTCQRKKGTVLLRNSHRLSVLRQKSYVIKLRLTQVFLVIILLRNAS